MKHNVGIWVIISIIVIICVGFVVFHIDTDKTNNISANASDTNISNVEATVSNVEESKSKTAIKGDIQLNKNLNFNVGEDFVYKQNTLFAGIMQNLTQRYKIMGVEKRNNIECYKILWVFENPILFMDVISNPRTGEKKTLSKIEIKKINITAFVSLDNGSFVDVLMDNESILRQEEFKFQSIGILMYAPWMLYLKDGKEFEIKNEEKDRIMLIHFKVVGREKIGNIDCFKVEMTTYELSKNSEVKKIYEKVIFWIDEEKKILIKAQSYVGNLAAGEMTLSNV